MNYSIEIRVEWTWSAKDFIGWTCVLRGYL